MHRPQCTSNTLDNLLPPNVFTAVPCVIIFRWKPSCHSDIKTAGSAAPVFYSVAFVCLNIPKVSGGGLRPPLPTSFSYVAKKCLEAQPQKRVKGSLKVLPGLMKPMSPHVCVCVCVYVYTHTRSASV